MGVLSSSVFAVAKNNDKSVFMSPRLPMYKYDTYVRQALLTAHAAMALAAVPVSSSFGMFKMSTRVLHPLHLSTSNGPLGSLAISPIAPTMCS